MNDKYERPPRSTTTDDGDRGDDSDATETLPDRFDSKGNKKGEQDSLNELISGLASRFLGSQQQQGGGEGEEDERRGRRHRH